MARNTQSNWGVTIRLPRQPQRDLEIEFPEELQTAVAAEFPTVKHTCAFPGCTATSIHPRKGAVLVARAYCSAAIRMGRQRQSG
jgi:hypothetical protein